MKHATHIVCLLLALLSFGCAGPWRASYHDDPLFAGASFTPTDQVEIREVEPERLAAYFDDLRQRRLASSVAVEDMPVAERVAEMSRLMEALRYRQRPPAAYVIGVASFGQRGSNRTSDASIRDAARRRGADAVIVCRDFKGIVRDVRMVTASDHGFYHGWAYDRRRRPVPVDGHIHSTRDVPVPVDVEAWQLTGYFIRHIRPGDPTP
jgi:hypothetical protein